jgi:hypothetical protein
MPPPVRTRPMTTSRPLPQAEGLLLSVTHHLMAREQGDVGSNDDHLATDQVRGSRLGVSGGCPDISLRARTPPRTVRCRDSSADREGRAEPSVRTCSARGGHGDESCSIRRGTGLRDRAVARHPPPVRIAASSTIENVHRSIEPLVSSGGLIESTDRKRNRIWSADEVLHALDAFAARVGRRSRAPR